MELILSTPPDLLTSEIIIPLKSIYDAWILINSESKKSHIEAWKLIYSYGEEIIPGSKIFKLRGSLGKKYFALLNVENVNALNLVKNLLFTFNTWIHLKNRRGFFHAAGIIRESEAYLFFGPSGAGKSTISKFSEDLGYNVVHDDHIVVLKTSKNRFVISNLTLSIKGVELKSMFFLVQNDYDKIVPLTQALVAKKLLDGFLESMGNDILYSDLLKTAFRVSSEIARSVPGYMLHFTRSPEFWNIIDNHSGIKKNG